MHTLQVVILNPNHSIHSELLQNILKNYSCTIFNYKNEKKLIKNVKIIPDLIFTFFGNDSPDTACQILDSIHAEFNNTPIIGVLERDDGCCDNCLVLKNKFWGLVEIPFKESDIVYIIQKIFNNTDDLTEATIENILKKQIKHELLIGKSEEIENIKKKIGQVAPFDVNVIITGESGTGKELSAKMIHYLSNRSKKQFVPINCGAIPDELFENELFGHKKGAYTNADASEMGVIKVAEGGTLFLDEVESLSNKSQVKLLRFLEDKKYKPLGQSSYVSGDVRIISAAKGDLNKLIKDGAFRDDLFYRLNIVEIKLPPLRDRKEDIPLLTSFFLKRYALLYNKEINGINSDAIFKLLSHNWPGNVRELENTIQEAIVSSQSDWLYPEHFNIKKSASFSTHIHESFNTAKQKIIKNFEISYIENTLKIFNGNIKKAAEFAQKDRRAFYNLMNKYDINPSDYRVKLL